MEISVCLIVKNEEEVIERCLKSVRGFADEIVVADTGSVDKTKEIVKKYTDKLYDFNWVNDFSAARNFVFSKAKKDYLFWIDADDVIEAEDEKKILELKKRNDFADTYMMKYCVDGTDGMFTLEFFRERLMRNCKFAKFSGFVHECVSPFGKIKYTDIRVIHKKKKVNDPNRNLRLYEFHLKRGVAFNARERYYYAKELYYVGDYERCEKELKSFLKTENRYHADEWDAFLMLFDCMEQLGESGSENCLFAAIEKFGFDSKTLCKLGDWYKKRLCIKDAENCYKMSLACEKNERGFFYEPKYDFLEPCLKLVELYKENGKTEKANDYNRLIERRFPT